MSDQRRFVSLGIGLFVIAVIVALPKPAAAQSANPSISPRLMFDPKIIGPAQGGTEDVPAYGAHFLQIIQFMFGIWDEGSATWGNVIGAWNLNFSQISVSPAPAISAVPRPQQKQPAKSRALCVIGVTAEGGFVFSDSTITFMGGPRVTFPLMENKLFAYGEFLFGGLHWSADTESGTDFLLMPAFGVLYPIKGKWGVTGEVGFPIDYAGGTHATATRIIGGVVIPLGLTHK